VGDAAAIPILSAILETFPSSAKGVCVIEIPTKEDEQILETNADIEFIWLYNKHPEMDRFGYVACEFSAIEEIRNYLRKELGWTSGELYAYLYWKEWSGRRQICKRQTSREKIDGIVSIIFCN